MSRLGRSMRYFFANAAQVSENSAQGGWVAVLSAAESSFTLKRGLLLEDLKVLTSLNSRGRPRSNFLCPQPLPAPCSAHTHRLEGKSSPAWEGQKQWVFEGCFLPVVSAANWQLEPRVALDSFCCLPVRLSPHTSTICLPPFHFMQVLSATGRYFTHCNLAGHMKPMIHIAKQRRVVMLLLAQAPQGPPL